MQVLFIRFWLWSWFSGGHLKFARPAVNRKNDVVRIGVEHEILSSDSACSSKVLPRNEPVNFFRFRHRIPLLEP